MQKQMKQMNEHKFCLEDKEADAFIALLKSYQNDLSWTKSNNSCWRSINFIPNYAGDELSRTIPGAVIQIEFKYNKRIAEPGKMLFTLFKRKPREKLRAYQLETSSEHKITSHDGVNPIYGSHEHVGKRVIKISPVYKVDDIVNWFSFFCDKIHLDYTGSKLNQPSE